MKDGSFAYTAATGAVFRNSAGKNHASLRTGTEGQASRRGLQYLSDNVLRVCTGVLSDATAVGSAAGALVEKHGQLPAKLSVTAARVFAQIDLATPRNAAPVAMGVAEAIANVGGVWRHWGQNPVREPTSLEGLPGLDMAGDLVVTNTQITGSEHGASAMRTAIVMCGYTAHHFDNFSQLIRPAERVTLVSIYYSIYCLPPALLRGLPI